MRRSISWSTTPARSCASRPERHPDEYWDRIIAINLDAQFLLSREIGKGMLARGSGKIIFTASLLTFQGGITVPGYAASKGGIGQLTKALANEWAGRGVPGQRHRARLCAHGCD